MMRHGCEGGVIGFKKKKDSMMRMQQRHVMNTNLVHFSKAHI